MSTLVNIASGSNKQETKESKQAERVHIFVSDTELDQSLFDKFHDHVTAYSQLFVNRTLEDLVEKGITKIWLNIKVKDQKEWLQREIIEDEINPPFIIIPVYTVKDTWVEDILKVARTVAIKSLVTIIPVSLNKLTKATGLEWNDLIKNLLAASLEIDTPKGCLARTVKQVIKKL